MEYILEVEGVSKHFPGVKALTDVDFKLIKGEVHALIGENGAGKSTLMKIITGIYRADNGVIKLYGQPFVSLSPKHAKKNGISMIYQEFNLIPDLTVAENIYVAHEPGKLHNIIINDKKMHQDTQELLDSLDLDISPIKKIKDLSVAEKQMVEIAKALVEKSEILILDEPTSALAENEVNKLFDIIRMLTKSGVAIIYISHRLEELNLIADRVTVMRDGHHIKTALWKDMDIPQLILNMVGRDIIDQYPERESVIGDVVLEVKGVNNKKLKNVSLKVHSGEVLGIAGLMGAGRTEFARAIFGADKTSSGEVYIRDKRVQIKNPNDAVKHDIAYLPEDRKKDGLMLDLEVDMNILAASMDLCSKSGIINKKKSNAIVDQKIRELGIKTPSAKQIIRYLSGGNQQKALVARWLCRDSNVIIFDEPTRGIDVGAKYEIYSLINQVAKAGAAIIMISSEMLEVLGMSDRIIVMCEGSVTGEIQKKDATQERILEMASMTKHSDGGLNAVS